MTSPPVRHDAPTNEGSSSQDVKSDQGALDTQMDWPKLIESSLRLKTRVWFAFFVALSVVVFASKTFLSRLGLESLPVAYRRCIGGAWLIAGAILLSQLAAPLGPILVWYLQDRRRGHKRLQNLTPEEKRFLAAYLSSDSRTQYADINSGMVSELEANHIVRCASDLSVSFTTFPYNIQPWAWDYLKSHPEAVALSQEDDGSPVPSRLPPVD